MNSDAFFAAAGLLLLSLAPLDASAGAAEVQRCRGASGTVIYTDRPCKALSAIPLPMPAAMRGRIEDTWLRGDTGQLRARSGPILPRSSARRRMLGCSRSAGQLSSEVQQAVATNDVNRLAESYHWVGQSSGQARRLMQRLEQIVSMPLQDARIFDAQIFSTGTTPSAMGAGAGMMQIEVGPLTSSQLIDLDVVRYAGCYFARF